MLSVLYIFICCFFGISLLRVLVPDERRLYSACLPHKKALPNIPDMLFIVPAGIITGIMLLTAFNYYVSLGFSYVINDSSSNKEISLAITFAAAIYLSCNCLSIHHRKYSKLNHEKIPAFSKSIPTVVYFGICAVLFTAVASFLMYYTYHISDDILYAGFSTFSDLSPHTAMTSSFGVGGNVPTQYMHYSGDGIRYHFFFYYFCGILEFLGAKIDFAINIPSIIVMVCAFCLLGLLAVLLSGKRTAYIFAPVLVLFRSSLNVFIEIKEYMAQGLSFGDSVKTISESTSWLGSTPYDSWGIWAINVYPNQRHLMLGVSVILIVVILMMPYVRRMCINLLKQESFGAGLKTFFASKEAWLPRKNDPLHPVNNLILVLLLCIVMPYFHGSALIAMLLILFFMAIFSENRLSYLAIAVTSVVFSFIQTKIFSGNDSNVVSFQFVPGFVVEDKSLKGILTYILIVTGGTLIFAFLTAIVSTVISIVKKKPVNRIIMLLAFMLPFVFAFTFQVTLEMLANHKFIQISLILADAFVASMLAEILTFPINYLREHKPALKVLAHIGTVVLTIILLVPLTATGVSEWCTYINLNKNALQINTKSELALWIEYNTPEDAVFLTPNWSLNRFFLAGRASYYAWPYYAWSAGYDTDTRGQIYEWLISGCNGNIDEFTRYCKERGIKYLIADPDFYSYTNANGENIFAGQFFADNLEQVAYFAEDNNTIVYQIYK